MRPPSVPHRPPVIRSRGRRPALAVALALVAAGLTASVASGPASAATIDAGDWYTIANRHSGKLIDVPNCDTADGAMIQQWAATGAPCQQFRFEAAASGWWTTCR
mgnify:FL=1